MSKPGALVTILYKRTPDLKFDLEYYLNHHIPLASKLYEPYGLLGAIAAENSSDAEYAYTVILQWKDLAAWEAASKDEKMMKEIIDDVPKFTNGHPTFLTGKVLG